eukprot:5839366-Prymnesium_polylepis.1
MSKKTAGRPNQALLGRGVEGAVAWRVSPPPEWQIMALSSSSEASTKHRAWLRAPKFNYRRCHSLMNSRLACPLHSSTQWHGNVGVPLCHSST